MKFRIRLKREKIYSKCDNRKKKIVYYLLGRATACGLVAGFVSFRAVKNTIFCRSFFNLTVCLILQKEYICYKMSVRHRQQHSKKLSKSLTSTNSGWIVVEWIPSLWKNSLTCSAIFIYSDKLRQRICAEAIILSPANCHTWNSWTANTPSTFSNSLCWIASTWKKKKNGLREKKNPETIKKVYRTPLS